MVWFEGLDVTQVPKYLTLGGFRIRIGQFSFLSRYNLPFCLCEWGFLFLRFQGLTFLYFKSLF